MAAPWQASTSPWRGHGLLGWLLCLFAFACTPAQHGDDPAEAQGDAGPSEEDAGLDSGLASDVWADSQGPCVPGAGGAGCACVQDEDCAIWEDGDACNGVLFCHLPTLRCAVVPLSPVTCKQGGAVCAPIGCVPATGQCAPIAAPAGLPCDDGEACTTGDTCLAGECVPGQDICGCHSNADCAAGEDGDACNGTLYCDTNAVPYTCKINPATVVAQCPPSKNPCQASACDPKSGKCASVPLPDGVTCEADGSACTAHDSCKAGACVADAQNKCDCLKGADCAAFDDGKPCNGKLFCDLAAGKCKVNPTTVIQCSGSGGDCKPMLCDDKTGSCVASPVSGYGCEDGNACTANDVCLAGTCKSGPNTCQCQGDADCAAHEDGDLCNGTLYCDKAAGVCVVNAATVVSCPTAQDTACLAAKCQPGTGKCAPQPLPDGAPCDDGFSCTKDDVCDLGACVAGPNVCPCGAAGDCGVFEDGDPCNGTLYCDKTQVPNLCRVNPATVIWCPSGKGGACLPGACDPKTGACADAPAKKDLPCEDGNPCTNLDTCDGAGKCAPGPNTCACKADADCAAHEDGDPCTGSLYCDKSGPAHVCAVNPGTVIQCADVADTECRVNQCDPGDGKCKMADVPEGQVCEQDGEACTLDRCTKGSCVSGPNLCACLSDVDCAAFEDDNPCNGKLMCDQKALPKVCVVDPKTLVTCPAAGPCGAPVCDPKSGACVTKALNTGQPCDDGNKCTAGDACLEGSCAAKPLVAALDCDDQDPCTVDGCHPAKGCTHAPDGAVCDDAEPCTEDSCDKDKGCSHKALLGACEDGDACTTGENCATGSCTGGVALTCLKPGGCAIGSCVAGKGCVFEPKACGDGNPCTEDGCKSGTCTHTPLSGSPCEEGAPCVEKGQCSGGKCVGKGPACDDDNPCTDDKCQAGTGCAHAHAKDGKACDDGQACTEKDHCLAGTCKGAYTEAFAALMAGCDDANPCTIAGCDPITGCVHLPVAAACNDGDACTSDDHCDGGQCVALSLPATVACDDGSACTQDGCDPTTGCSFLPVAATCTDGDACTVGDHCEGSKCVAKPLDVPAACDDGKACTTDGCDPKKGCVSALKSSCDDGQACTLDGCQEAGGGLCVHLPRFGFCDDGDACTKGDLCQAGKCVPGAPLLCDDGAPCTADSCDSQSGCVHLPVQVTCSDGDACTTGDACAGSSCAGLPLEVSKACDDGNVCSADSCNAKAGCQHAALVAGGCSDGDACTTGDACAAGVCKPGASADCDDGDACTADTCQAAVGCAHSALAEGATCGKGKLCLAGQCAAPCPAGQDGKDCDDGSPCTFLSKCAGGVCKGGPGWGEVETVAGSGQGYAEGAQGVAAFNGPRGIAIAPGGVVFVADTYNHCVRRIGPDGVVSTLAGDGTQGAADGQGKAARFKAPTALALAPDGTLVVADTGNHRIRRVSGSGVVTTVAGSAKGHADGVGAAARFDTPEGVAVDGLGRVYVADAGNQRVRRIAANGAVSTFAGTGVQGHMDGPADKARFAWPSGIALGADEFVYIADTYNHRIRRLSPAGVVVTLAGSGKQAAIDGPGAQAAFSLPAAVTVDLAGRVWVADRGNHRLRRISKDGVVATAAGGVEGQGDGPAAQAGFSQPRGVAVAADGRVWLADAGNHRVRLLVPVERLCADANQCTSDGCSAETGCVFKALTELPCDDADPCTEGDACDTGGCVPGPAKVCDDGNACTDDSCAAWIGCQHAANAGPCDDGDLCTQGDSCTGGLCQPGKAVDCDDGSACTDDACDPKTAGCSHAPNAAACDDGDGCTTADACRFGACGAGWSAVSTVAGTGVSGFGDGGTKQARFQGPAGVSVDASGAIWVADLGNHRVRRIIQATVSTVAGTGAAGASDGPALQATFSSPADVVCGPTGAWVADLGNHKLRRIADGPGGQGQVVSTAAGDGVKGFADGPAAKARLSSPRALALAPDGGLVFADQGNHRVRVLRPSGVVSTLAGSGLAGFADGPAAQARFQLPSAVAVAPSGVIWVADGHNHRLRRLGLDGVVLTVAGAGNPGFADGAADKALLNTPAGLALDGAGRLYFSDQGNHRVRVRLPGGQVMTLAGSGLGVFADGPGHVAGLAGPAGLALDAQGGLLVAGFGDQRVRRLSLVFKTCDDGQICTLDTCTPKDGACGAEPISCDDGSPCTADACVPGKGCTWQPAAGPCNDGDACSTGDWCKAGQCVGQAVDPASFCDDANPCTAEICAAQTGCAHLPKAATCTDGDLCTAGDVCAQGKCKGVGVDPKQTCDDGDVCTDEKCDPLKGCLNPITAQCDDDNPCTDTGCDAQAGCTASANSAPCEDGDACTLGDSCAKKICQPGAAKTCDDGQVCTQDTCDKAKGCVFTPAPDGAQACDDGSLCTAQDTCAGGKCQGKPIDPKVGCDDKDVCTDDKCDPKLGCVHPVAAQCDDGNACTDDKCDPNQGCSHLANGAPCSDNSACTVGDACADKVCKAGKPANCDDKDPCSVDSCDAAKGCLHAAVTTSGVSCDDGDACTKSDTCGGGKCVGQPLNPAQDCDDKDVCTDDKCDAKLGCVHPQVAQCDDKNPCTTDKCDKAKGCTHTANASTCEDGNPCTTPDQCTAGKCQPGGPKKCDDGNACTDDGCDPGKGCTQTPNSAGCDDGDACTKADACAGGACAGVPMDPSKDCDDKDACTKDACEPAAGGCKHVPIGALCDDGEDCTTDTCDKAKGCVAAPKNDGVPCSDGDACTSGDACKAGKCSFGAKLDCDDGNACSDDACDKLQGCTHSPNQAPCDDQDACTDTACKAGQCALLKTVDCDDGKACTSDTCDPKTAACKHADKAEGAQCGPGASCAQGQCISSCAGKKDGAICDDGDACTWDARCQGGKCVPPAASVVATLAGGGYGFADGVGTAAQFKVPIGLSLDTNGDLWVTDDGNHAVRKVAPDGTVTTVAGNGSCGNTDAKGKAAKLCNPYDVVPTGDGGAYVADRGNHRVRRVAADGTVTTYAGSGGGADDGIGTAASFWYPSALALAGDGTLWVGTRYRIRKIAPGAVVTTAAGGSSAGTADGKGTAARFYYPYGLALDDKANLFIADYGNHRIRRMAPDGTVTTVAGESAGLVDGVGTQARLRNPWGLTFADGVLFFSDGNHRIRALMPSQRVVTLAGSVAGSVDGPADTARFYYPAGLAKQPGGRLFVADRSGRRVRAVTVAKRPCDDGNTCSADACDPLKGTCFHLALVDGAVCDDGLACTEKDTCAAGKCAGVAAKCDDNNACTDDSCAPSTGKCVFTPNTKACEDGDPCTVHDACVDGACSGKHPYVIKLAGTSKGHLDGPADQAKLGEISDLALGPKGDLYFAQYGSGSRQAIRRLSPDGKLTTVLDRGTGTAWAWGVAAGPDGSVYAAISYEYRIRRIGPGGSSSWFAGSGTSGTADGPPGVGQHGVFLRLDHDGKGTLWVADLSKHRVRKVLPDGTLVTVAGDTAGFADGKGAAARFKSPGDLATDGLGQVYVADSGNHRIRKVAADGTTTTLAGSGVAGFADGPAAQARFSDPSSVDVDASGVVWVTDAGNKRVRRVAPDGSVSTWVGGATGGPTLGPGPMVTLGSLTSVVADPLGRLFFVDGGPFWLLRVDPAQKPCSDGNLCTTDGCESQGGTCTHKASGDGQSCGSALVCAAGACVSTCKGAADGAKCDDGQACTVGDACKSGACATAKTDCNDGEVCTEDACNPLDGKCLHALLADGQACDDASACTAQTACKSGVCLPGSPTTALIAGSGYGGYKDGTGPAVKFNGLMDAEVGPDGFIYLADAGNNRIRRATSEGVVTTWAGTGEKALKDGPRDKAAFSGPGGLSFDSSGVAWIADSGNHAVRRVGKDGVVSVLAGNGQPGDADGQGAAARFNEPWGIDAMADGSAVFVADSKNNRVRRVTPDGVVTTVAGNGKAGMADGPADQAMFGFMMDLSVDHWGRVYIADQGNSRIRRLADGQVQTWAGTGVSGLTDGPRLTSRTRPNGIDWHPSGAIYIAENSEKVRILTPDGQITTISANLDDLSGVGVAPDGTSYGVSWGKLPRLWKVSPKYTSCADEDPCTADSCDPQTGKCSFAPIDDGSPCGPGRVCGSGACVPACVGATDGTACDDADPCTVADSCKGGACSAGKPKDCDDGSVCTTDACADGSGKCTHTHLAEYLECDDTLPCTANASCLGGQCKAGSQGVLTTVAAISNAGNTPADVHVRGQDVYLTSTRTILKLKSGHTLVTVAGGSGNGYADGPVSTARFQALGQLASDAQGSLWVADFGNQRVRKLSADGLVTTVAGDGEAGLQDGQAWFARFNEPRGLARDPAGNLYVADTLNHRIRKITPAGTVTTLAGSSAGFSDGSGAKVRFNRPESLALDPAGSLYVADTYNHRIRRVAPDGTTVTLAGSASGFADGQGGSARFNLPTGIARAGNGDLIVADRGNYRVRRVTAAGLVGTLAGGTYGDADGPGDLGRLGTVVGVAIDLMGAVYVIDYSYLKLRKWLPVTDACDDANPCTADTCDAAGGPCKHAPTAQAATCGPAMQCDQGKCTSVCAGKADGAPCSDADPCTQGEACKGGVCAAGAEKTCSDGQLCTADTCHPGSGTCIHVATPGVWACDDGKACTLNDVCVAGACKAPASGQITTTAGSGVSGHSDGPPATSQLWGPRGLALDGSGQLVVADTGNNRIRTLGKDGVLKTLAGAGATGAQDGAGVKASFYSPHAVATDATNRVVVADTLNHRLRRIDATAQVSTLAGEVSGYLDGPASKALFSHPEGVAVDGQGYIWVSDTGNHRVRRMAPDGTVSTVAGSSAGFADGSGAKAAFSFPGQIAMDGAGRALVADRANNRLRRVDPDGLVVTLAGSGVNGSVDGPALTSPLSQPRSVVIDGQGRVYFTEMGKLRALWNGQVSTVAGGTTSGWKDGSGATALFEWPAGLVADNLGRVHIADSSDHRLRLWSPPKPICDDHLPCTIDVCDNSQGCLHTAAANGSSCEDGNACTAGDTCKDGKCAGQPLDVKTWCDDKLACTDDGCAPNTGCTHTANGGKCADGSDCSDAACGDTLCNELLHETYLSFDHDHGGKTWRVEVCAQKSATPDEVQSTISWKSACSADSGVFDLSQATNQQRSAFVLALSKQLNAQKGFTTAKGPPFSASLLGTTAQSGVSTANCACNGAWLKSYSGAGDARMVRLEFGQDASCSEPGTNPHVGPIYGSNLTPLLWPGYAGNDVMAIGEVPYYTDDCSLCGYNKSHPLQDADSKPWGAKNGCKRGPSFRKADMVVCARIK